MSEHKIAEMHPDFARWYSEVSMDGAARANRWSGIDEIAANVDKAYVEVLVRLAFDTKAPASGNKEPKLAERLAAFHAALRKHDETYDATAAREVQVLAACALVQLFGSYPFAALAVTTAGLAGARQPELPMDLFGFAENAIRTLSEARRRRPQLTALSTPQVELPYQFDVALLKSTEPPTFALPIEGLRAAAERAIQATSQRMNLSLQQMGHYVQVADEELQMLWWVIGERSLDLGTPFHKVEMAAQPLVFGRELADRTVAVPGPVAIGAILSRAGLKQRGKVSVAAAVSAASTAKDAWVGETVRDIDASPVTSPIHFALEKRMETGAGEAWVAGWAAVSNLPQDHGVAPAMLGELFYRERLLLKFGT